MGVKYSYVSSYYLASRQDKSNGAIKLTGFPEHSGQCFLENFSEIRIISDN